MKKLTFILITLTMLLVIPSLVVFAAEPANPLVEDNNINSYSIVYSENGKVSFQNHGKGIDQDSVFELASNGKVIAAYVALSLVNEGMLDLDDKIVQYLSPTFIPGDDRLKDVTVRHLLSHTAGFSPSFELGVDKKIYSEPGSEFRYSGVGYIYLQDIIENVSDMTMEQSAKHYVFEPLKMGNTTFEAAKTVTPYMALSSAVLYAMPIFLIVFIIAIIFVFAIGKLTRFKFFTFKQSFITCLIVGSAANIYFLLFIFLSRVMIIFAFYMLIIGLLLILTRKSKKILYLSSAVFTVLFLILSFVLPVTVPITNDLVAKKANCAYTLKSTSQDMAKFCQELMMQYHNGSETMKNMFEPVVVIDDVNSWGLGVAIEKESQGNTYWHSGINPGFQSLLVIYPQQNKYAVILTNSDNGFSFVKNEMNNFLNLSGKWEIKR